MPSGGNPIEITTFRSDGAYTDGRHPDSVAFSRRLEDDLSRRDFTVNAMAWHPQRGLVDLFHGQEDLSAGLLRCVGEPARRFSEDALRILRCLRFSSQLGFAIHPDTARALWEKRELLLALSHERVREELTKLLRGQGAAAVLRQYAAVVFTVLPELAPMKGCAQETPYHCFDVWEHTLHAVDYAPQQGDLRWAALLHDAGKPGRKTRSADGVAHFYGHPPESGRIARQLLTRLRFSNKERDWIAALVDHHEDAMPMGEVHLKGLLGRYGERFVFTLFQLQEADMSAKAPGVFAPPARLGGEPRLGPRHFRAGRLPDAGGHGPHRGGLESFGGGPRPGDGQAAAPPAGGRPAGGGSQHPRRTGGAGQAPAETGPIKRNAAGHPPRRGPAYLM